MIIEKIETPSWNGYIKAILSRYPHSFQFEGIQDNYLLDFYEWWAIKNNDGLVLGIGWIDIGQDTFGEVEAEISICVNTTSQGTNVGSILLSFPFLKRR